jgi:type IVB pilus formation R64 PilN family outer membrane protein
MIKMNKLSLALMSLGAITLTGCAGIKKAEDSYKEERSLAIQRFETASNPVVVNGENRSSNFNKVSRNYVNPKPLEKAPELQNIPSFFNKPVTVTMPGTVNAVEILSELQRASAISFKLDKEVYDNTTGFASIIKDGGGSGGGQEKKSFPVLVSDFVFQGTLKDALDLFTAKTGLSWKWNGAYVEVFKFESITYKIAALAGTIDSTSSVNLNGDTSKEIATAGGGGSGGASSTATSGTNTTRVSRTAKMVLWEEIKTTILSLMSPDGSLALSEAMGTVTVRDTPFAQLKINRMVEDINKNLMGQVLLNVDIYEVSFREGDDLNLDWTMAWQTVAGKYGFNFASLGGASTSTGAKTTIGIVNGNFKDSKAMISALSTLGRASVLNSFTVTTLSGQPAPIAVNRNIGYLKSMTRQQNNGLASGSVNYSLEPGNVSTGININVKPKILKGNEIMLEYVMNLSDMETLREIISPDESAKIEVPTTTSKSASQIATLKSGQTLVMSGFKQKKAELDDSGVGSPKNILLGGKKSGSTRDSYLVVTVTPYIAKTGTAK